MLFKFQHMSLMLTDLLKVTQPLRKNLRSDCGSWRATRIKPGYLEHICNKDKLNFVLQLYHNYSTYKIIISGVTINNSINSTLTTISLLILQQIFRVGVNIA